MKIVETDYGFQVIVSKEEYAIHGVNIIAFGCSGTGKTDQLEVAAGLNAYSKEKNKEGCAVPGFQLGDIAYNNNDLDTAFYTPYAGNNIPFFYTPGNHEYGYDNWDQFFAKFSATGISRAAYFLKHERRLFEGNTYIENSQKLFKLNWKAEGYYKVQIQVDGDQQPLVDIFMVDSNTIVLDEKQKTQLQNSFKESNAKYCGVFCHNPLETHGDRKEITDAHLYEIKQADGTNYTQLFRETIVKTVGPHISKLKFIVTANDHYQDISEVEVEYKGQRHKIIQIISAGSGGSLQDPKHPTKGTKYCNKEFGFATFNFRDEGFKLGFRNKKISHYVTLLTQRKMKT